ncbi:helix-turn-helix domain-containing protein [Streptomyces sp. ME19-01-6]|uniref:helix-turn-helix domain-containing protein n=1 Tax=Streptomyces sp. ME19-01-6 TaxID=3028686 RepID=UPI0029BF6B20|nr:helix-turn-helix domain-containing protein [Streptomyces sp. ME19-01-6]MDX3226501.1 helix-turn-helix domain-containing protein [Streptomyces sp. ME19-01-6]
MAEQQLSAHPRAHSVVRQSAGGVTQISDYQPKRYTIIGDHLTQHHDLSLTAIGLGAHIQSLPDGAAVDIRTLAGKFHEGRDRIAAALRELEDHGYLKRVRERTPEGRIVTRTLSYNVPGATGTRRAAEPVTSVTEPVVERPTLPAPEHAVRPPAATTPPPPPSSVTTPTAPPPLPEPNTPAPQLHRTAAALLAELRRDDERLLLAERDVRRLAPGVAAWLERGAAPDAVRRTLAVGLPPNLRHPAALLAHRLTAQLPPPLPTAKARSRPAPLQNCGGCDRAFRAPRPGLCRDCREAQQARTRVAA